MPAESMLDKKSSLEKKMRLGTNICQALENIWKALWESRSDVRCVL